MDLKELNSNAMSIQTMFTKAVAGVASGQALGAGFAELLSNGGEGLASVITKDGVQVADKANVKVNASPKESESEKTVEAKTTENSKKTGVEESAPKKDKKKKSSVDDEAKSADMPVMNKQVAKKDVAEPIADVQSVDDNIVIAPMENIEAGYEIQNVSAEAVTALDGNIGAVLTVDGNLIVKSDFDIAKFVEMPVVKVFDDITGEITNMSGAEFVANIKEAISDGDLLVFNGLTQSGSVEVLPAILKENTDRDFGFADIESNEALITDVIKTDPVLVEQAKVLDDKIGSDKKVKIEVNINEENISYADDVNLIQDKLVLDEAVKAVLKEKNSEGNVPLQNMQNGVQQNNANSQVNVAIAPATLISTGNVAQFSGDGVQSSVVEGVSSVSNVSGSALNGANIIGAEHRTEGNVKTFDASSKDVFKGMSKEVVEQVKVNITKSAVKGVDKIDVQLKPQDLGNIEIKLQIAKDGKLQAHIIATKQETMDMLQREVQDLERAFNEAGFDADSGSFSFSFRGDGSESEQRRNAELRSFIGNALEQNSEDTLVGNDNLHGWNSAQGLNIKV